MLYLYGVHTLLLLPCTPHLPRHHASVRVRFTYIRQAQVWPFWRLSPGVLFSWDPDRRPARLRPRNQESLSGPALEAKAPYTSALLG